MINKYRVIRSKLGFLKWLLNFYVSIKVKNQPESFNGAKKIFESIPNLDFEVLNSTSQSSGRDGDTPNHCLVEIADSFMTGSDTTKRGLLAHLTVVSGATAAVPSVLAA